jgi:hypothetical protein
VGLAWAVGLSLFVLVYRTAVQSGYRGGVFADAEDEGRSPGQRLLDSNYGINPATGAAMINSAIDATGNPMGVNNDD